MDRTQYAFLNIKNINNLYISIRLCLNSIIQNQGFIKAHSLSHMAT